MSGSSHPISGGASGAAAASAPGSGSGTDPTGSGVAGAELADQAHKPAVSRVRALYDFAPTEPGELAFSKGDIIRVLDSVYKDWWRGELRGEAGIFPVNYVVRIEALPIPLDVCPALTPSSCCCNYST